MACSKCNGTGLILTTKAKCDVSNCLGTGVDQNIDSAWVTDKINTEKRKQDAIKLGKITRE